MLPCTCMSMAWVTPKNAERVPSIPDMTSGNKSFRITIVRPKPRALNIPIRVCVMERMLCSTQSVDQLIGPVPSPNEKEFIRVYTKSHPHGENETYQTRKSEIIRNELKKPKLIYHDFIMKNDITQVSIWLTIRLFFS